MVPGVQCFPFETFETLAACDKKRTEMIKDWHYDPLNAWCFSRKVKIEEET